MRIFRNLCVDLQRVHWRECVGATSVVPKQERPFFAGRAKAAKSQAHCSESLIATQRFRVQGQKLIGGKLGIRE